MTLDAIPLQPNQGNDIDKDVRHTSFGATIDGSINIKDSNIGVAVKDSSIVNILNYEGSNVKYCSTIFRKKQEFGPSNLRIEIDNCGDDLVNFVQKGSIYSGS